MGLEMKEMVEDFFINFFGSPSVLPEEYWKFEYNKKLEYDRNRFQQLFLAPFDEHFEQTLTFMGSSMESLRNILAEWTLDNEVLQESGWEPKIKDSELGF